MAIKKQTIEKFLEEVCSKAPTPGGGAAAALSGAMAAALVAKVARLTIGKEKYKEVEEEFQGICKKATGLMGDLLNLADEDVEAYQAVVTAHKEAKDFNDLNHQSEKNEKTQKALKKAAEVPMETVRKSVEALYLASFVAAKGNQNAVSDARCAIELAIAAIYGALENVRINLALIKDQKFVESLRNEIDKILSEEKLKAG